MLAVDDGRPVLDRADGEDRDLRGVEDGDELLDPEHPEVRDREGPALEVGELELPVARTGHDVGAIQRDLLDGLAVGVADHRHDEAARRRDCETDVRGGEAVDPPLDEVRVDRTMAHERRRDDSGQHVRDGRLRLALAQELDHALARRDELGRVRADRELEDGRLPRFREPPRDRLARRRELDDLVLRLGARRRGRGSRPERRLLHVLRDDAALGPGADDLREVDTALTGDSPRERARLDGLALGTDGRLRLLLSLGCFLSLRDRLARSAGSSAGCSAGAAAGAAGASPFSPCAPATSAETSSSWAPMMPTVVPTSTSPSATTIFSRTPSDSASTSCVTLSVSSSKRGSPFVTASPSVFSQRTIVPDSMPWPSRGSLTSVAISSRAPPSGG